MSFSAQHIRSALLHLRKRDATMDQLIRRIGPFTLKLQRDRFASLVRAIVAQQISAAAARTIMNRLVEHAESRGGLKPVTLVEMSLDDFRSVGISPQKTGYLMDLARKASSGELQLPQMGRWPDEKIVEHLIQVKGIGRWTAEMFLIFSLGRLNVLPCDDLGIRKAIQNLYLLDELPDREEVERIGSNWRPYASVASWYCWRSLENEPD